ncbi:cilia- and flagella-associated protein 61 [Acipenser ruthenus]|uniref:cilia- and flagella-associated protein 61 n=1 Tax=Acipenser ruthenus TaxID=7906 RepID=UPI00274271DD|nr:cilia- and flagella-associated protein 61 [Acipenser ruthenus]
MRTITSSGGVAEVINARRTESLDAQEIINLIQSSTRIVFGRVNVIYLLEKANLTVTLTNGRNEVVAHAAFVDYPNLDNVDQTCWESWLHSNYHSEKCTPLNTLFMHLFVALPDYYIGGAKEIIRTVFNAVPELYYIFLFVPNSAQLDPALEAIFEPFESRTGSTAARECAAFVCHRHHHCPVLHIRSARVQDHDDLTPLFTQQSDKLAATYGDYFLAELIEAQDEENHAVVCEVEGTAVGFMSLCSDINIKLLNECFELGPFHGLCKPHPEDILDPLTELQGEPEIESDRQASQKPGSGRSQQSDSSSLQGADVKVPAKVKAAEPLTAGAAESLSGRESALSDVSEPATAEAPVGDDTNSNQKNMHRGSSEKSKRTGITPVYKGALNAFCIQLFAIDEKYEMRSLDFLPYVFKLYPDRDLCIITVPHLVPEFPLLQRCVRAIPFHTSTLSQELYIFHRSGLLKSFTVRQAKSSDKPGVESLIKELDMHETILEDFEIFNQTRRDPDGTPVQAFVAEVLHQIVGIAIIRNEEDITYIRSHYNIEDFIYFSHHRQEEHGQIFHFVLNPIFQHNTKHFLKEILRLSDKSCLYYPVYPSYELDKNAFAHSLTSALNYMVPVRPRRQIVYPLEELGINAPARQVAKDQVKYALYHINRKLTLEPKVTINARIVVVGASDTGMSFLEMLVFCPHLRFNNITLISTHGLPGIHSDSENWKFLSTSHCYNDKDFALLSLRSWVNVVVGKMKEIDRAAKHVVVSEGRKVPYDHLILCTGQQYQMPCPTGADISTLLTNRELSVSPDQRYTGPVPSNVFTLNDDEDCLETYNWLQENWAHAEGNVIVYGNTIDAYTTVETLLSLGISGCYIHLAEPPLNSNVTCFNNFAVETAVQAALAAAGVTVYHNCILAQWNGGNNPEHITAVCFTTDTKPVQLQCSVFINLYKKGIDYDAFKAMNDACLVYDGRLVIDTTFHTNDSAIRAAGTLTKFPRRYHADQWSHSNFNSKEVGFHLATAMLPLFDPILHSVVDPPEDLDRLIPMYTGAKVRGGKLPGGYHYLHAAKPRIPIPLAAQMDHSNYGRDIITGSVKTGNYFKLHVNEYSKVETITCLSQESFPASNYLCLYGENEQLLNKLCDRFDEGLILDMYSFFKETWCLAIYHDRFIDFKNEVHQIMAIRQDPDSFSVTEIIQQVVEEEGSEDPKETLKMKYEECNYRNPVERYVLNYLKYNRYHLPMYAQPGLL